MSNKYKELKDKLEANHAVCEGLKAELDTMQPPEIWVCYYENKMHAPEVITSEAEAKTVWPTLVNKIVRYVLPEEPITPPEALERAA